MSSRTAASTSLALTVGCVLSTAVQELLPSPADAAALLAYCAPLIEYCVARYSPDALAACGLDREDLRQEARLAILAAAPDFDAARGASFLTFLRMRIHHHLVDVLRQAGGRAPVRRLLDAEEALWQEHGTCRLDAHAVARRAGVPFTRHLPRPPEPLDDQEEAAFGECRDVVMATILEREQQERLRAAWQGLPDRERRILAARFFDGTPVAELAVQEAVSAMRIWQLQRQGLDRLRAVLAA